jgi:hypothetical protein
MDAPDGGHGYTLVDNDASNAETFVERSPGANANISQTKGSILPEYTWSAEPRLLCESSMFLGDQGWVTHSPNSSYAWLYPTTSGTDELEAWQREISNGNFIEDGYSLTQQSFQGNVGIGIFSVLSQPDCMCDSDGEYSGLGSWTASSQSTCRTWVK